MKMVWGRHAWGLPGSWLDAANVARDDGYSLLEIAGDLGEPAAAMAALRERGLGLIPLLVTRGQSISEHLAYYKSQLTRWKAYQPRFINMHSGSDAFSVADAINFYRETVKIDADLGLHVVHETHRGRAFYNPWLTRDVMQAVPELRLCADLSHWVCVCERLLDCDDIIDLLASRCDHIHARVGYEQGPQVPDPSAKEYSRHLLAHEQWWRLFLAARAAAGHTETTITPEFGPPNYLHTIPHTNEPVADLRWICNWMKDRLETTLA